jgi:SAM-dependent methyltransferase
MTCPYEIGTAPGGLELTGRAITLARLSRNDRILDIGCGSGGTVAWLRRCHGFRAIGLDVSRSRMETGAPLVQAQAERLPFASGTFECVLAECSLSVTKSQTAVVAECARILVRGGRLLLTDMYARNPGAIGQVRALGDTCVAGMILREELAGLLAASGFHTRVWEDHSESLRIFMARQILETGSPDPLWGHNRSGKLHSQRTSEALKQARPGYFLLLAEAESENRHGR